MPTLPNQAQADSVVSHAGVALRAADSGRLLMLQRANLPGDPNAGLWEFPGGHLDPDEAPLDGAKREFAEEVGVDVPQDATDTGTFWDLPPNSPKYRLHLLTVPTEKSINLYADDVPNPDDYEGVARESVAFWEPSHITGPSIRPEVLETMKVIEKDPALTAANPVGKMMSGDGLAQSLDAEEQDEGKVVDLLIKAAELATDPELKKIIEEAKNALAPAMAAAAPPIPGALPGPAGDGTQPTQLENVAAAVSQAKALHQGHMDGTVPTNSASQQSLMDLLDMMDEILNPPPPMGEPTQFDALIASTAPVAPPDDWFAPFELDGPTPLTVTADGRVFGHLATWDSCHRSGQYGNKCTRPPSDPNAPFFQMGQVMTASGATVDVGVVTVGGGHASADKRLVAAIEHYDDVSTAAATVTVHEDDYGIGLFGSVVADADPPLVAALRRSPLSGDWRKEKGSWRLVAAHAVNTPGFPIPRGLVASGGDVEDATAFFTTGRVEAKEPVIDLSGAARRLAKSAGLDTESLVASARAAMADVDCGCDDTVVASLSGDTSLPVADYSLAWDGGAAADRVFAWAQGDTSKIGKAFLWRNEQFAADIKAGWDLPFADVIDGTLKIVPRGVQATAGGHGVGQLDGASDVDKNAIKAKIGELYKAIQAMHPESPPDPFAAQ